MRRNGKHENVFSDIVEMTQPFLPDETSESARAVAIDLRDRLVKLEQQMLSQYSAMAAYATIAQQSVETARAESRHDLDRSQATMIGLMERVRREVTDSIAGVRTRLDGVESGEQGEPGPGGAAVGGAGVGVVGAGVGVVGGGGRVVALERRVEALERTLVEVLETQRQLVEAVAELTRERMEREGWLVSNGSPDDLTLR